jgi:hypothetical protein
MSGRRLNRFRALVKLASSALLIAYFVTGGARGTLHRLWLVVVFLCAAVACSEYVAWKREWRHTARIAKGQCPACGYDLTGNVSGVCPECGAEIQKSAAEFSN